MTSRKKQPAREKRHSLTRSLSPVYPFAAIVGQDDMKLALLLSVLDPYLGGVVIMGHRGTGKSTAVRALADLVPARTRVKGCLFNCDPDRSQDFCQDCSQKARRLPRESFRVPVVDLPLGATEDRVCGSLDIERALTQGTKAFEPGLLAKAHRGFLYIDEVNLLEDFLVDLLLDAAASGRNQVEREGISVSHPARFVLVGSGNPEEGELRPQLLDRFGLFVGLLVLSAYIRTFQMDRTFHWNLDTYSAEIWNYQKRYIFNFFKHYMLLGVETPKINIPFFITIDSACKTTNLELLILLCFETNRNSLLSLPKFQYE